MIGQGDALDTYSHGLQAEAVKARQLSNSLTDLEAVKGRLAQKVVQDKDANVAKLFEQVFPCCPPAGVSISVTLQ